MLTICAVQRQYRKIEFIIADYRSTMTNLTEGHSDVWPPGVVAITFRQTYEHNIPTIDMDGPLMMLEYE